MNITLSNKKHFINSDLYQNHIDGEKITIIDGGARGEIFPPFSKVNPALIRVIRFEPDPGASIVEGDNHIVLNKGIWSHEGEIKLHLNKNPNTSSVYPPNKRLLAQFENKVGLGPREVVSLTSIEVDSIDNYSANNKIPRPDFIKLDVHSSEYEALEGAIECLQTNTVGVLVEAWCFPIHKGQKTHADVAAFLNKIGFYLFDQNQICLWPRNIEDKGISSKPQFVAFDSLFFKDVIDLPVDSFTLGKALKYIAIAELFGHASYAIQLNNYFKASGIIPEEIYKATERFILTNNKTTFAHKILNVLSDIQRRWIKYFDLAPF